MIRYSEQHIDYKDISSVIKTLKSDFITTGPQIQKFEEKPKGDGTLINGGYFVLSPKVIERIQGDKTIWEQEPLKSLASDGELMSFKHEGFWQPMDTLADKQRLNELFDKNKAPWKVWK